ncbi:MAG: hypothetical protein P8J30_00430 [Ilumatobacter sp.]|nr:hypothetical protein [Ilumatobacter sp.]
MAAAANAQDERFPNTKSHGRAAVEYQDDAIHLVAAYYYSQQNHDSRWLLIEAAVSTGERMSMSRAAFRLIIPDGQELVLAEQTEFARDSERTRPLLQNARTTRHSVAQYIRRRNFTAPLRFFRDPFGPVVQDEFVVDKNRVIYGDLFFTAPTGLWEDGTYSLIVEQNGVRAAVPIVLE